MLSNKKLCLMSDCYVDDERIASFAAVIDLSSMEITMNNRHIDKELCKTYRDTVRADQVEFEDYAYSVQDMLKTQE